MNNTDLSYIKFIPMTFDVSLGEKFDISDNEYFLIENRNNRFDVIGQYSNMSIEDIIDDYPVDVYLKEELFNCFRTTWIRSF